MALKTCAPENFRSRRWGLSGGSRVRRPGSEDPHRRERKFNINKSVKKALRYIFLLKKKDRIAYVYFFCCIISIYRHVVMYAYKYLGNIFKIYKNLFK